MEELSGYSRGLQTGLDKPRFFILKSSLVVFLIYICPEERVFRVFSVSRILLGASRL
jgi:hypothetical protein